MDENDGRAYFLSLYTRVLLELANNPRISQETLARKLDVTMRTAQRHLTELEGEGYIRVDRNHKPFQYQINWSRPVTYAPWLKLVVFHPTLQPFLNRVSEMASGILETTSQDGTDPDSALAERFSQERVPA